MSKAQDPLIICGYHRVADYAYGAGMLDEHADFTRKPRFVHDEKGLMGRHEEPAIVVHTPYFGENEGVHRFLRAVEVSIQMGRIKVIATVVT